TRPATAAGGPPTPTSRLTPARCSPKGSPAARWPPWSPTPWTGSPTSRKGQAMTPPGEWPQALRARPVCPKRQLPIPYIAEIGPGGVGEFTILDNHQAIACLRGRLCAMCGERMDGDVALIGDVVSLKPDGFFIEPPVHERCGEIATGGLCPFLSRERVPRR